MNPDVLLNRIRLEQRGLIDIHKKLYEMEHRFFGLFVKTGGEIL